MWKLLHYFIIADAHIATNYLNSIITNFTKIEVESVNALNTKKYEIIYKQKKLSDSPNNFFIILIHLAFYYGAHSLPVKILKLNLLLSFS